MWSEVIHDVYVMPLTAEDRGTGSNTLNSRHLSQKEPHETDTVLSAVLLLGLSPIDARDQEL